MKLAVAIDGPAGAGKSTIAKILGKKFDLMYINTGAMYRAVTFVAMKNNIAPTDIETLCSEVKKMEMHFENDELYLNGENINDRLTLPDISKNVSEYAAIKEVRTLLVDLQRNMAQKYDSIMDGRDIGTVVLKDAKYKFFLTATPEERADRRYKEFKEKHLDVKYEDILEDIKKRDYYDTHREVDPLRKADDAVQIDTTGLDIDGVVNKISKYIVK
ncbi:(d)CMP kinase [Inconstantimicrobium porci]|uniref:Cytidylate kinase n=3 Tax=Inconstantimicrobium porci TaxID=2652291 RepID=A0A7X2MW90_9CLOT|nr:(d)CMP kinase [Inconstantimicrobium porci]